MRGLVAEVKAELAQVAGEVTVVQEHGPGAEAEVDTKPRSCVSQSFYSVPVRLARRRVPGPGS